MFNGLFTEGTSQKGELPEDDPTTFGVFLGWLCKGVVEIPENPVNVNDQIRMFAFAEKYSLVELQDKSIESLIYTLKKVGCLPNYSGMAAAYTHTHVDSKLRLFMARIAAYVTLAFTKSAEGGSWSKKNMTLAFEKCPELAVDALDSMRGQNGIKIIDPREHPLCDYHQHGSTEPCP